MPKSKSQAEKEEERKSRREEQAAKRREEKVARDSELKNNLRQDIAPTQTEVLSKKASRQQKKQNAEQQEKLDIAETKDLDNFPLGSPAVNNAAAINRESKSDLSNLTISSDTQKLKEKSDKVADRESKKLVELTRKKAHEAACEEDAKSNSTAHPARVVQNHSTYCEGLKPVLIRLQKYLVDCKITPGEISDCNSNSEVFDLLFQRAIDANNYKFVARNGRTTQDVFINVPDPKTTTVEYVRESIEKAKSKANDRPVVKADTLDEVPSSTYNRMVHNERNIMWRTKHHQQHVKVKQCELDSEKEQKIREQSRKLASKVPADAREQYAKRDVAIIAGESRTKNSM